MTPVASKDNFIIAPSMLCANFQNLAEDIRLLGQSGADWLHFDVMDGQFVENLTYGPIIVEAARPLTDLFFDVHLMIQTPLKQVVKFAEAGADLICLHVETVEDLMGAMRELKRLEVQAGVALNPDTPVEAVAPALEVCDQVMLMSVFPGRAGQKFIEETYVRLEKLAELIEATGRDVIVEVDGGVVPPIARRLSELGARAFVSGSYFFKHPRGYAGAVHEFRDALGAGT